MQRPQQPENLTPPERDEATRRVERTLEEALPVAAPAQLNERIHRATEDAFVTAGLHPGSNGNGHHTEPRLSADGLAGDLHRALAADPPADLADRTHRAAAEQFEEQMSPLRSRHNEGKGPAVLARIGPTEALGRAATAAAVLALVVVGVWRTSQPAGPPQLATGTNTTAGVETAAEPAAVEPGPGAGQLARQIEQSLQAPVEPIDTRIMALSAEVDQLAQAVEFDPPEDPLLDAAGRELERSYMLEGRIGAF